MKKQFFILFALFILLITSCTKNEELQDLENETTFEYEIVDLQKIVSNFDSELATFSSYNEFASFLKQFKELDAEQRQSLTDQLEYERIEEILDRAYEGMIPIETREEFIEYLKQYEKYLELVELPNGEEEVQEKEITGHTVYTFLNGEKIVKIGETYQKYLKNYCVESENIEELKRLESVEDVKSSNLKHFIAYDTKPINVGNEVIQSRWGELGLFRTWEEIKNEPWCKNDRKATFTIVRIPAKLTPQFRNKLTP